MLDGVGSCTQLCFLGQAFCSFVVAPPPPRWHSPSRAPEQQARASFSSITRGVTSQPSPSHQPPRDGVRPPGVPLFRLVSKLLQGVCFSFGVVQPRVRCERRGRGPAPPPLNEPEDDMSGLAISTTATYTWVIKGWSTKRGELALHSELFGGHDW
jgi:hypothetical protein